MWERVYSGGGGCEGRGGERGMGLGGRGLAPSSRPLVSSMNSK